MQLADDVITPPERARELTALLPRAKLVVVPAVLVVLIHMVWLVLQAHTLL